MLPSVSMVLHSWGAVEKFECMVLTSREMIEYHGTTVSPIT